MSGQVGRPGSGSAAPDGPPQPADEPVDGFEILERVAALPITTWRYQWEAPHVRHLGPMAQDWAAAFGLGDDDTRIAVVDASGVTLVSVQALYRLVAELREQVTELRARLGPPTTRGR